MALARDPWAMINQRGRAAQRQRAILGLLRDHDPEPLTPKGMMQHIGVSSGYMSDLLAQLQTTGLVQTTAKGCYVLTAEGREVLR